MWCCSDLITYFEKPQPETTVLFPVLELLQEEHAGREAAYGKIRDL